MGLCYIVYVYEISVLINVIYKIISLNFLIISGTKFPNFCLGPVELKTLAIPILNPNLFLFFNMKSSTFLAKPYELLGEAFLFSFIFLDEAP